MRIAQAMPLLSPLMLAVGVTSSPVAAQWVEPECEILFEKESSLTSDYFGWTAVPLGDVNDDGVGDIAVSAVFTGASSGSVIAYSIGPPFANVRTRLRMGPIPEWSHNCSVARYGVRTLLSTCELDVPFNSLPTFRVRSPGEGVFSLRPVDHPPSALTNWSGTSASRCSPGVA